MSIQQKYTFDTFPKWAMPALINDDTSDLNERDEKLLDAFLARYDDVVCWDYEPEVFDDNDFRNYPLFGRATDCCTIHGYIQSVTE